MSVSTTPVAVLGPLLVTLIEYVRFAPTVTEVGAEIVTPKSAVGVTAVVTLAELFVVTGSAGWLVMLTESVIEGTAAAPGVTTIVTASVAPAASVPRETVGLPGVGAVPCGTLVEDDD